MEKKLLIGNYSKKILKIFHIIFASIIFGSLLSIFIILIVKVNCNISAENIFGVDLNIFKIFTFGVSYAFFALLVTSFVYGLFTEWGFIKYRWIIFKWMIVLSMFSIVWFELGPAINGMTSISDAGLNTSTMSTEYLNFQRNTIAFDGMEILAVLLILVISVLKPWGIRKVKRQIRQKIIIVILLPLIVIGISFGVMNSVELNKIRNMPIKNIDLINVDDGTYNGEANAGNYLYKVKVKVKDHRIIDIKGIDNRKSPYVSYAEGIFTKIIKTQKMDVDAVTGATTTSKAFMKAVENALSK
jgi:uncharacterized protein with FMN-binding domain